VWATDRDQAELLQTLLKATGCEVSAARGGNAEDRTLNIDIGVVALEGLECLRDAGYSFRWHPGQHLLDRAADRYGIPVAGSADFG
jgi:hypothetical protein